MLPRSPRRALALVLALAALPAGCGGPPPAAREAQRRLEAGDIEGAEELVDRELATHPREPLLWQLRIRAQLASGNAEQAVATYREWRQLRGEDDRSALRAMALMTLWQALVTPSPDVRLAAVEMIERREVEPLAEETSRRLEDDDDRVRAAAAGALLHSHPDAPTVLADVLAEGSPTARRIAVEALGRKAAREALATIERALHDPDVGVRAAAAVALRGAGSAAVAPLLAAARTDAAGQVRASATRSLVELRERQAIEIARAQLAAPDPYLGVRLAAIEALDRRGGDRAVPELRAAAARDDRFVALRAGVALARRGDRAPGLAALQAALAAPEWPVRAAGLNAAADIASGERATSLVRPLLGDPEAAVRLAAARALLRLGRTDEARVALAAGLTLPSESQRLAAAIDLARLGDARGTAALAAIARDGDDPESRRAAVLALPWRGDAPSALTGALADPSGLVRVAAAERLL